MPRITEATEKSDSESSAGPSPINSDNDSPAESAEFSPIGNGITNS